MEKVYYSIAEVAEMFGINQSKLRFWEKQKLVTPHKTAKGTRQYSNEDIEKIRQIHHLREDSGKTLAGVKRELKNNGDKIARKVDVISRLQAVRTELAGLKKEFEVLETKYNTKK